MKKKIDLTAIPEEEFQAEVVRRALQEQLRREAEAKEKARIAQEKRTARNTALENGGLEILLILTPNHERTSCSDKFMHPDRCARCILLMLKEEPWMVDDFDFSILVGKKYE